MNIFIWKYVGELTENYHSGGGLVVFAGDERRAREIASSIEGCSLREDEKPDEVRECSGSEGYYVFPDAGCC